MKLPHKLLIPTDGNELEYVETLQPNSPTNKFKKELHIYRYTKSETKLGMLLPLPQEQLDKMVQNSMAKIIE